MKMHQALRRVLCRAARMGLLVAAVAAVGALPPALAIPPPTARPDLVMELTSLSCWHCGCAVDDPDQ
jgi:hypothetical protein